MKQFLTSALTTSFVIISVFVWGYETGKEQPPEPIIEPEMEVCRLPGGAAKK
jgi:hypothetical protein